MTLLEQLLPYLTLFLGGTSIVQFVMIWQNRKANAKSAAANAVSDEANSLKVTAEVFTILTEIIKKEVAGYKEKVEQLEKTVDEYKLKCGNCTISNKK